MPTTDGAAPGSKRTASVGTTSAIDSQHAQTNTREALERENPGLYLALSAWCVWGISTQVFLPYLITYLERYPIAGCALVLAVVLTGASAVSVLARRVIDRVGKARFLAPAVAVYAAGLLLMPLARGMLR